MKTKLLTSAAFAALLTTAAVADEKMKSTDMNADNAEITKMDKTEAAAADRTGSDNMEANASKVINDAEKTADQAWEKTKDTARAAGAEIENAADGASDVLKETAENAEENVEQVTAAATTTAEEKPMSTNIGYVEADDTQIRASNLIGKFVYNGSGENAESIGDVNDVILNENGETQAIVIGVGGFLGIGEKDVAVEFDRISWFEMEGEKNLSLDATREELEAAPAFGTIEVETGELEEERETETQ